MTKVFEWIDRINESSFFIRFIVYSVFALIGLLAIGGFVALFSVVLFFVQCFFGVYAPIVFIVTFMTVFIGLCMAIVTSF